MKERKIFRYVEKRLYSYPSNMENLRKVREQLEVLREACSVHGLNYDAIRSGGGLYSDPVSEYFDQVSRAERTVAKLTCRVEPVIALIEDIYNPEGLDVERNAYHLTLLEKFYFQKIPMTELLRLTHWSRSAFYARRYDLVQRAREHMRL